MRTHLTAVAALAVSILLAPVLMEQATAGHGGGGLGGAHFGGMGAPHLSGMGGPHVGGMGGAQFIGGRIAAAHISGDWHGGHFSGESWARGRHVAWNGGAGTWHGQNVWHGHNHDHFIHDHHDHFHNRFVAVRLGWWPGYSGYDYGYNGCGWLRHQARITDSPYWWERYYACANY